MYFLIDWTSDTCPQECTDLQSPVKCLDHRSYVRRNMQSCKAAQCFAKHVWSFDRRRHMCCLLPLCYPSGVVSDSTLFMHDAVLQTTFIRWWNRDPLAIPCDITVWFGLHAEICYRDILKHDTTQRCYCICACMGRSWFILLHATTLSDCSLITILFISWPCSHNKSRHFLSSAIFDSQ